MDAFNLISVAESASRELTAGGARMVVSISGQAFFTGTQAFKKAVEVAACVAALKDCGIAEDDIKLLDVAVEVESGFFTKSSSATYDLEVRCRSIDALSPVIVALGSQKNAKVRSIAWDYPDLAKMRRDVLQEAVRAAQASAAAIASALGAPLAGVHRLSYQVGGLDTELQLPRQHMLREYAKSRASRGMELAEESGLGLTLSHTTRITVTVKADFLIGPPVGGT